MVQKSEHLIANEENRTSINAKAVTMVSGDNGASIGLTNPFPISIGDGANLDAFSRLRVSTPTNLFSVSAQYGAVTVQMERNATGTGVVPVHNANTRMVALSCTAGTGTSYMQSFSKY